MTFECHEMDEMIPCKSMWVMKSVKRAEIVDYCCEVRSGSEGPPLFFGIWTRSRLRLSSGNRILPFQNKWKVFLNSCIHVWKWPVGFFFWPRENVWRKVVFEPFPRKSNTARLNKRQTCTAYLFCYCSMPKCWDNMVQCKLSKEWLQMSCEGCKTAPKGEWLCIVCRPPDSRRLRNC